MAASHVFDRGYGKATKSVDLTAKTDMGAAHLKALKACMQSRRGDGAAAEAAVSVLVEADETPTTH